MKALVWSRIERAREMVINFLSFGPVHEEQPRAQLARSLFYIRRPGRCLQASVHVLPSRNVWCTLMSDAAGNPTTTVGGKYKKLRSLVRRCVYDQPTSECLPCASLLFLCVYGWLREWSPVTERLLVTIRPSLKRPYGTCVEEAFWHLLVLIHGDAWTLATYGSIDQWIRLEVEGQQTGWTYSRGNRTELESGTLPNLLRLLDPGHVRTDSSQSACHAFTTRSERRIWARIEDSMERRGMKQIVLRRVDATEWRLSFIHPSKLSVVVRSHKFHTVVSVYTLTAPIPTDGALVEWPAGQSAHIRLRYLLTTETRCMPIRPQTIFVLGAAALYPLRVHDLDLARCMLLRHAVTSQDALAATFALQVGCIDSVRYGLDRKDGLDVLHHGSLPPSQRGLRRVLAAKLQYPHPILSWTEVVSRMLRTPSVTAPLDRLARRMFRLTPTQTVCTAGGGIFGGQRKFESLRLREVRSIRRAMVEDVVGTYSMLSLFAIMRRWERPPEARALRLEVPSEDRLVHPNTGEAWLTRMKTLLLSEIGTTPVQALLCRMFRTDGSRLFTAGGGIFGGRRKFESGDLPSWTDESMAYDEGGTQILLYIFAELRAWRAPPEVRSLDLPHPRTCRWIETCHPASDS